MLLNPTFLHERLSPIPSRNVNCEYDSCGIPLISKTDFFCSQPDAMVDIRFLLVVLIYELICVSGKIGRWLVPDISRFGLMVSFLRLLAVQTSTPDRSKSSLASRLSASLGSLRKQL
jgi:hypothetical protein